MTQRQYQARTALGLDAPCQPRVVRLAAAPVDWEQRVLAACMSAGSGAGASHRCAAVLWRLRGLDRAPVEITAPIGRTPHLNDAVVHQLSMTDLTTFRGIPITKPAVTLLVLGSVVDGPPLSVEDAVLRRLTTFERLVEMVDRLGRSGRDGTAALRRLLEERASAAPTESLLEDRMARLFAEGRDRRLRAAVRGGGGAFTSPVRPGSSGSRSMGWRSTRGPTTCSATSLNRLLAMGWPIWSSTRADIRHRPDDVLAQLSMAMAA